MNAANNNNIDTITGDDINKEIIDHEGITENNTIFVNKFTNNKEAFDNIDNNTTTNTTTTTTTNSPNLTFSNVNATTAAYNNIKQNIGEMFTNDTNKENGFFMENTGFFP